MRDTREKPRGQNVDRTIRQNDSAAHKKLAAQAFDASRSVQGKPSRVDERPTGLTIGGRMEMGIQIKNKKFHYSHFAAEPRMIRGQRGVVQTPILQIVRVPLSRWQMVREFHPMSLSLVISKHGRSTLP
jgi:hypothetical protein